MKDTANSVHYVHDIFIASKQYNVSCSATTLVVLIGKNKNRRKKDKELRTWVQGLHCFLACSDSTKARDKRAWDACETRMKMSVVA